MASGYARTYACQHMKTPVRKPGGGRLSERRTMVMKESLTWASAARTELEFI